MISFSLTQAKAKVGFMIFLKLNYRHKKAGYNRLFYIDTLQV